VLKTLKILSEILIAFIDYKMAPSLKAPYFLKRGTTRIPTRYITNFHCGPTNLNDPLFKRPHQGRPEGPYPLMSSSGLVEHTPESFLVTLTTTGSCLIRGRST